MTSPAEPGFEHTAALHQVAALLREVGHANSVDQMLQRCVDLAVEHVDGCAGASIMLVGRGGRITTPAATSGSSRALDQAQYETGEGPCLDAIREHASFVDNDLGSEGVHRWPTYRSAALALGVRAVASFRLFVEQDTLGALNLYAVTPDVFVPATVALGEVLAVQAAVALRAAIVEEGLERALESRDQIGQAKGILMERLHLTADEAFAHLAALSQASNRPLRDVAADLDRTGELPSR